MKLEIAPIERWLSIVNELSGALLLMTFAALMLGRFIGGGTESVIIEVEKPKYQSQAIGTFVDPDGKETTVFKPVPLYKDEKPILEVTQQKIKGYGSPTIGLVRTEIATPSLGTPPYRTINDGPGRASYKPNIIYTGTGHYYHDKQVVFDGSGEPENIRAFLEVLLGCLAIMLLIIRFISWWFGNHEADAISFGEIDENLLEEVCVACPETVIRSKAYLRVENGKRPVCPNCIIRFLDEVEREGGKGLKLEEAIKRWQSPSYQKNEAECLRREIQE